MTYLNLINITHVINITHINNTTHPDCAQDTCTYESVHGRAIQCKINSGEGELRLSAT